MSRYHRDTAVVVRRGYRREAKSYGELRAKAVHVANLLKTRGICSGDRVCIWGPNSFEWVAAFWGCLLRGAAAVPLDETASPEFAAKVLGEAQVKLILSSGTAAMEGAGSDVPQLRLEDFSDSLGETGAQGDVPRRTNLEELADEPITRNQVAQILFTSGTTAEPRGVVLTHANFLANLEPLEQGIAKYRKYERWFHPLRFVSLVPLSHVFGQFMALFVPLLLGAAVVFENSAHPSEIIRTIKKERATGLVAVPRMLDSLGAELLRGVDRDGPQTWFNKRFIASEEKQFLRRAWTFRRFHRRFGWKFWALISGGAALSPETEHLFKRLGFAVVQGYGMTETASLISLNHPFSAKEGSVGKILPGREFRLAEDGEILVRGENVSSGYWEHGEYRAASGGDWLRTGDIGEVDAEGNLRFLGRKKNVIVTPAGLNIYPEDLETELRKQERVRDAVVVPVQMEQNAEPLAVLLLALHDDKTARSGLRVAEASADAVNWSNRSLAKHQHIRHWVVWPEADFPRTSTGKPRLALIAPRAVELWKRSSAGSTAGDEPEQQDSLARFISQTTAARALEGLSSLDRVELLAAIEQRYNVELNETSFSEAKSVADVRRLIEQPSSLRCDYAYPRWTQTEPVRWCRLFVYYLLVWPATQIIAHPRITGRRNLQGVRNPAIIVSNHITRRADIGLILAALPTRFRHRLAIAMGGETLQRMRRPPREWFVLKRWSYQLGYFLITGLFNVFPLPQFSGFRESFRFAGESVDRGYSLLIFPEGVVNDSADGRMAPFQSGIGLLGESLRLPIVPMRLDGVWQMKRERRRLAQIGEVTVHIGTPVTFAAGVSAQTAAQELEQAVKSL